MRVAPQIRPLRYGRLLAKTLPTVIQTEDEHERLLGKVVGLLKKGDQLSPEETELLRLMALLIEDYEARRYPVKKASPHEALRELMRVRSIRQRDLWGVIGSRGVTSEVVSGKRNISKAQAKALAEFFHVSPELFI